MFTNTQYISKMIEAAVAMQNAEQATMMLVAQEPVIELIQKIAIDLPTRTVTMPTRKAGLSPEARRAKRMADGRKAKRHGRGEYHPRWRENESVYELDAMRCKFSGHDLETELRETRAEQVPEEEEPIYECYLEEYWTIQDVKNSLEKSIRLDKKWLADMWPTFQEQGKTEKDLRHDLDALHLAQAHLSDATESHVEEIYTARMALWRSEKDMREHLNTISRDNRRIQVNAKYHLAGVREAKEALEMLEHHETTLTEIRHK
jgi:hypothetical protein